MHRNLLIVLIRTFHPGNIGAAARAMKTMGLSQLVLVDPKRFPDPDAVAMAAGAVDVLEQAHVVSTLDEAVGECSLVIGTSARIRSQLHSRPMIDSKNCARQLIDESARQKVALVFGQETMGLSNEELAKCHYHVAIDAHPDYPVLNVAAAVQIICYEIRQAEQAIAVRVATGGHSATPRPSSQDMEHFYQHLEKTLYAIGFIVKKHPGLVMTRLRRLFTRSRLENKELKIFRGILSAIDRRMVTAEKDPHYSSRSFSKER